MTIKYKNAFLFLICSLIWGSTWLIIKFQLNGISPIVGVFYRFILASIFMFSFNYINTKESLKYPISNHFYFLLQGIFNFSINYILTYYSEKTVNSGLIALTFTTLIYFNLIGLKIFFNKPISIAVFIGGIFGFIGLIILFWKDLTLSNHQSLGIFLGILATICASIGNMFAFKNFSQKIPLIVFNSYSMLYGALFSVLIGVFTNQKFYLPIEPLFYYSLLYLVIFGTMIAFWAYHTLVREIGPDRAAFTSIVSSMIAVLLSSIFEKTPLSTYFFLGIFFCLIGNFIALKKSAFKFRKIKNE